MNRTHLPGRENVVFCLFSHGTLTFLMKCSFAFDGPSVSILMIEGGERVACCLCIFFVCVYRAEQTRAPKESF